MRESRPLYREFLMKAAEINSDTASELLDLSLALLNAAANDRADGGPRATALLAHEPTLDLARMDALIDTLFAADPSSMGRSCVPYRVTLDDAAVHRVALDFRLLEAELAKLRRAAVAAVAHDPSRRWVHVLATMERYRDGCDLSASDPLSYTSLSIQDSGGQVPGFYGDLPRLADFHNLEILIAFGNDMSGPLCDCSALTRLRSVDLGENRLRAIPAQLFACTALEYLDLSDNPITEVPQGIEALTALRYLGLSKTDLTTDQIEGLRQALPGCLVHTTRRVYTEFEKRLNFVLQAPTWAICADRSVVQVPATGLPRGTGAHVVGARVDLAEGADLPGAARIDAADGALLDAWWRTADGAWEDVTARAQAVRPAFGLAGG